MKLATFLADGSVDPRSGEVRGDAVRELTDGTTVLDRLGVQMGASGAVTGYAVCHDETLGAIEHAVA